jgi:hypothetical protein
MLRQALVVPLKKPLVVGGVFSTIAAYRLCSSGGSWDPSFDTGPVYGHFRALQTYLGKPCVAYNTS